MSGSGAQMGPARADLTESVQIRSAEIEYAAHLTPDAFDSIASAEIALCQARCTRHSTYARIDEENGT
jgi:hypothetical protein